MTEAVTISPRGGDRPLPTWVAADACTLPTSEQPVRVAEFDALFAETLARTEQRGWPGASGGELDLPQPQGPTPKEGLYRLAP